MIANAADVVGVNPGAVGSFARVADHWIYVFMAGLFIVTILVGFIPDSIGLLGAVKAGERPMTWLPATVSRAVRPRFTCIRCCGCCRFCSTTSCGAGGSIGLT